MTGARRDGTPVPRDEACDPIATPQPVEPRGPRGDERAVTGEPVETDAGWVIPQQQDVGAGRTADTASSRERER